MTELNIYEIEKLEIAKKLIIEVENSPTLMYVYDNSVRDVLTNARFDIQNVLNSQYPNDYRPEMVVELKKVKPPTKKMKNFFSYMVGEVVTALVITSFLSGCASVICWGISEMKSGYGDKTTPDFIAQSQIYKGLAITTLGSAFALGAICSVAQDKK